MGSSGSARERDWVVGSQILTPLLPVLRAYVQLDSINLLSMVGIFGVNMLRLKPSRFLERSINPVLQSQENKNLDKKEVCHWFIIFQMFVR